MISGSVLTTISFPATQSVFVQNITTSSVNGGLLVNQGLSGSFGNSWNVVLSDGTKMLGSGSTAPLFTKDASATSSSISAVPISVTSVQILGTSGSRYTSFIYNGTSRTLYLRFGNNAATVSLYSVRLTSNAFFEVPVNYSGPIQGIWDSAVGGGSAFVTEMF